MNVKQICQIVSFRWFALVAVSVLVLGGCSRTLQRPVAGETCHVWEKVEITLHAENSYENPYTDVLVWVDLKGPDFAKRCYGFWDGGDTFRVRVLGTAPGVWTWKSGSNQRDRGLSGKSGSFTAVAWTDQEKQANPCRRGIVKPSANGHAFEYTDGTEFFLMGDTWWPVGTFRYPWYEGETPRPIGPKAGIKDYLRYRRKQGYNCIALVAALPNWANDDKDDEIEIADDFALRQAWHQIGTDSAKDMHDEDGNRAFFFPGKVPGYEKYFPDIDRINPKYFQNLDKKIDYMNTQGFTPFIEVARRDVGPAWKKYYDWPESYTRYIQYVWTRYQANNCLFSPIHFDWDGSLPAEDWNPAANAVIEKYGPPPFGTLASCNPTGSSLKNFGHVDKAKWLGFHQIGNFDHELGHGHRSYPLLTDMFNTTPAIPAINGEPYYDGQHDTEPGSAEAALFARSAMYGSVLSGGLGGHIYGAGKEGETGGAMWGGNVEAAANYKVWDGILWESGDQMRHMRDFVMSEGRKYMELVPKRELLSPNKSGKTNDWLEWAYCAATEKKDLFLLYFEKGCKKATLSTGVAYGKFKADWFNPRTGQWLASDAGTLTANTAGKIALPNFPGEQIISDTDWAMRLITEGVK